MKKTSLFFRYAASYLIFTIISLVILNALGSRRIEQSLVDVRLTSMENEADVIMNAYISRYYDGTMTLGNVNMELLTLDTLAGIRIWIVNAKGYIISDTRTRELSPEGERMQLSEDFLNVDRHRYSFIEGINQEPVAAIVHPIVLDLNLKGYIVLMTPLSEITRDSQYFVDTLNICFLLFSLVFLIIMIYLYRISIVPLRQSITAAREYADGHFDYRMKSHAAMYGEFNDLMNTIEYMAGEMNRREEYERTFIANISHDFRSPLTSIKGFAEAMIDGTIPPEMHEKYLHTICQETERLEKLTQGLLELNTYEGHREQLTRTTFDVVSVIRKTCETFEGSCRSRRISMHLVFDAESLPVNADQVKIEQVLYNLIDNAIKFSPDASTIDITAAEKGSKVFVSVKDHGVGISKENQKKIWDRFFKSDSSRGKNKKGNGLGLSIVKEIIKLHGEEIDVISTEGVGSEFVFSLSSAGDADSLPG